MSDTKKPAEAKTEAKKELDPDELVPYTAPLLPGRKQKDQFLSVNGETCVVKRGVQVQIKRKFREVAENAQAQQMAAYQAMESIQNASKKASADM